MQTSPPVQAWLPAVPAPHWLPRFCELPHTLYVLPLSLTGLHWFSVVCCAQAVWFGESHEIQQSWWRQMEPAAHEPCEPSTAQVKVAAWLGTQPFSSQTSPDEHAPPWLRGTQAPATHTSVALPQSFVMVHACRTTEHTPVTVMHAKPSRQSALLTQLGMHLPDSQFSPASHCDWSKHSFAAAVQMPPPVDPATQAAPPVQSESASQLFAVSDWQLPSPAQA